MLRTRGRLNNIYSTLRLQFFSVAFLPQIPCTWLYNYFLDCRLGFIDMKINFVSVLIAQETAEKLHSFGVLTLFDIITTKGQT